MAVTRTIEPWDELLQAGRDDDRLVTQSAVNARAPRLRDIPDALHPEVAQALRAKGIEQLYAHQVEALHAAWAGPTVVTTGTASGKSLCFQLPTLDVLARDRKARALYLYPTKALAQDQARALHALGVRHARPAIFDGDTPKADRAAIRRRANVVLTNPDMLHLGILPNHAAWGDFFTNLAVVVVDEAHVYRGIFGSHVANVLRRLLRIADAYGTAPRVLMASATIANPGELAGGLTGLEDPFTVVSEDGSPGARKTVAMWNPPIVDEALGTRRSVLAEASDVLAELTASGARTIVFMKSRKGVELMAKFTRSALEARGAGELAELVVPYRAGYTPAQRRELERRLVAGELLGVISTDALELGIDIGSLDAAVCVTFPGTVASLRQMWGRAGRRGRGLAVYVAGDDALDQFFCRHPDEFLDRPVERAIINPENEIVFAEHLLCAAHEGPLQPGGPDDEFLGPRWTLHAEALVARGELRERPGGSFVLRRPEEYPAGKVSLRSAGRDAFTIVDTDSGELLGTVESARAYTTTHEGAIYLHGGRSYEVAGLDERARHAYVRPFTGDWYTQPKTETDTQIERLLDRRETMGVTLSFGEVVVSEQVMAYQRKRLADHEVLDLVALDAPLTSFRTQALWYELDRVALDLPLLALLGALHAAEHAQIAVLPLLAMCDRWDIGGLSTNAHPQTGGPTIFIYDGHPGGIGITRQGFRDFEALVDDAHRLISECPCQAGCPSCVQSPKCGNLNEPLAKAGSRELMGRMLGQGSR